MKTTTADELANPARPVCECGETITPDESCPEGWTHLDNRHNDGRHNPRPVPHRHAGENEDDDICTCGAMFCPDTRAEVDYYPGAGHYRHRDGSGCFLHRPADDEGGTYVVLFFRGAVIAHCELLDRAPRPSFFEEWTEHYDECAVLLANVNGGDHVNVSDLFV